MILFAALVKVYKDKAWKSYRHEDGEYCFGGGWFIVGIDTPEGTYTYHYENKYWDMFDCIDLPRAKHWDGHTEADAETRLLSLPERKTDEDSISRQAAIDAIKTSRYLVDAMEKIIRLPSAQPNLQPTCNQLANDCISRQAAIDAFEDTTFTKNEILRRLSALPSAQSERLTDDDFETIRIHLSAYKEQLGNQHRWEEAEEYQRIIDRFMRFASAQPEQSESEGVTFWKKRAREYEAMLGELTTKITEGMTVDSIVINKDGIVFKGLQPERKKGKWMEFDSDEDRPAIIKCPCCKHTFTVDSFHWTDIGLVKDDVKFCPNCGEDMREGDTDES